MSGLFGSGGLLEDWELDPQVRRSALLPVGVKNGEMVPALPQMITDLLPSLMAPGEAYKGKLFSNDDAAKVAFDIGGTGSLLGRAPAGSMAMNAGRRAADTLPMDEASRMARAREMGFTTDAYHGTTSDISEFITKKGSTGEFGPGTYLTDLPKEAGGYAGMHGADGQNIMPVMARLKNPLKVSSPDEFWKMFPGKTDDEAVAAAKAMGYDGVAIKRPYRVWDDKLKRGVDTGEESTHYVVFDPKNIRSRFAAFDPAKADSADLLAMNGNPALAALLAHDPEMSERKPVPEIMTYEDLMKFYRAGGA